MKKLLKKQGGGSVKDNKGYLSSNLHNYTPTKIIDSNHITTDGMAFPIIANGIPLYPNTGDFFIPGNKVVERPLNFSIMPDSLGASLKLKNKEIDFSKGQQFNLGMKFKFQKGGQYNLDGSWSPGYYDRKTDSWVSTGADIPVSNKPAQNFTNLPNENPVQSMPANTGMQWQNTTPISGVIPTPPANPYTRVMNNVTTPVTTTTPPSEALFHGKQTEGYDEFNSGLAPSNPTKEAPNPDSNIGNAPGPVSQIPKAKSNIKFPSIGAIDVLGALNYGLTSFATMAEEGRQKKWMQGQMANNFNQTYTNATNDYGVDPYEQTGQLRNFFQRGGRMPIEVTDPNDSRLKSYNDSLNLYKAYQFQKSNTNYKALVSDYAKELTNIGHPITASELQTTRNKNVGKPGTKVDSIHGEFNYNSILKNPSQNYDPMDAKYGDTKIYNYYKSLPFNSPVAYGKYSSPDIVHKNIKPIGVYFDGIARSPIYKQPVQPIVYSNSGNPNIKQPAIEQQEVIFSKPAKVHGNIQITSPQQSQFIQPQTPIQQPTNWQFNYPIPGGKGKMAQQYFNSQAEYDTALKQAASGQRGVMGNANFMGSSQEGDKYSALFKTNPQLKYGGIHVNPANKGKFNALKAHTGETTEELTHSSNPLTRKRAIFAQNASHWKHQRGGFQNVYNFIYGDDKDETDVKPEATSTQKKTPRITEDDVDQSAMLGFSPEDILNETMNSSRYAGRNVGDNNFRSFATPEEGRQALENQLRLYQIGRTKNNVKPSSSLYQAMSTYAPEADHNKPIQYAEFIAKKLGISPNTPIANIDTKKWADAITIMEGNKKGNNPGNLRPYQQGGTYDLSEEQIQNLIKLGYKIKRV